MIARLLDGGPQVLATGGGAFMNAETRDAIAERGVSVWLKPEFRGAAAPRAQEAPTARCCSTADPEETLRRLLEERVPTYALADLTIESRDGPHDSVGRRDPRRAAPPRWRPEAGASPPPARSRVEVPLGARAYSILIGPACSTTRRPHIAALAPGARCAIVTDATVAPLYLEPSARRASRRAGLARHGRSSARRARRQVLCRIRRASAMR